MGIITDSPKELLLSQINSANSPLFPLTVQNAYFGTPSLKTDGTSVVPVGGFLGSEYIGYTSVTMRRINLSKAMGSVPLVKSTNALSIYDLLPTLSRELGFTFNKEDIVNGNISIIEVGEQANVEIAAAKSSLSYTGKFIVKYQRIRILLSIALAKNTLGELRQLPTIPNDRRSLEMAMFNMDFTDYKANFNIHNGAWYYPAKIRAMAIENGFSDWPTAARYTVQDFSTKDHPYANKAFDRVAIQDNVDIDGLKGSAYFHYNLS